MRKVCVVIPAHCPGHIIKLTIASFLNSFTKSESRVLFDIHVGLHSNYADYTDDLSIFEDLKGTASIHLVDEIDWIGEYNAVIHRYSVMHAKNLINLFNHVKHTKFDYIVILDQDLLFGSRHSTGGFKYNWDTIFSSKADIFCDLFEDRDQPWKSVTQLDNRTLTIMPKMSVWHCMLSRKAFDILISNPAYTYPVELPAANHYTISNCYNYHFDTPIFFDTLAGFYHAAKFDHGLKFESWPFACEHFYKCSFNYGERQLTAQGYKGHVAVIKEIYDRLYKGLMEPTGSDGTKFKRQIYI